MDITILIIFTPLWIVPAILFISLVYLHSSVGVYTLGKPSEPSLERALARADRARANHIYTGGTRSTSGHPLGKYLRSWQIDFDRVQVGQGEHAYSKAKKILASLEHIQLQWSSVHFHRAEEGAAVIFFTKVLGVICNVSPLRITYAAESSGSHHIPGSDAVHNIRQLPCFAQGQRFDVALTSLEGSPLSIEERCSAQWSQEDDSVWYELYSISKPATLEAFLGYPLLRYYQRKIRDVSIAALERALALEEHRDGTVDAAMRMWDAMKMG